MKLVKKSIAIILSLLLVLGMTACGGNTAPAATEAPKAEAPAEAPAAQPEAPVEEDTGVDFDTIPLKLIAPITGTSAQYGENFVATLEIAIAERNAQGGIHGAEITLDIYDDKNDAKETVSLAQKVLSEDDTFAVLGPYTSTCALAAGPLLQEEGIIMLAPSSSHADFTAIGDYMFRGVLTQEIQGSEYAKYLKDIGATKIGILYWQDDTGLAASKNVSKYFTEAGGEVAVNEPYQLGTTKDFSPMLTKIKAAGCDAIFTYGQYDSTAMILNQARALDMDIPIIGMGNVANGEFFGLAGDNADGTMTMAVFNADYKGEKFQAFKKTFEEKTGNTVNTHAVALYDLVSMLFDAIEEEKTLDPAVLKDWIRSQTAYEGLCGPFAMKGGDPQKSMFRMVAKDGEFVVVD